MTWHSSFCLASSIPQSQCKSGAGCTGTGWTCSAVQMGAARKECGVVRAHLRELQRCSLVCKTVHGVKAAWEEPGTLQFLLAGVRVAGSKVQQNPNDPYLQQCRGLCRSKGKEGGQASDKWGALRLAMPSNGR